MNRPIHQARTSHLRQFAVLGLGALLVLTGCADKSIAGQPSAHGTRSHTETATRSGSAPATPEPSVAVPGLPSDWAAQAIQAATASIKTCAHTTSLMPPNCPQQAAGGGDVLAAHWTILNQPLGHAVAVSLQQANPSDAELQGKVAVYGQYQMQVSFTLAGQGVRPFLGYLGGIAEATMTWDGHSFQNVAYRAGSVTTLPPGVPMPVFSRPAEVSDAAALQAVRAAFHDCVTIAVTPSMTTPPNCPNSGPPLDPYFTELHWSLTSDPMQGALVSFDTEHGNFAVTGSFTMTLNTVRRSGANHEAQTFKTARNYTATLVWDGQHLTLLNIGTA